MKGWIRLTKLGTLDHTPIYVQTAEIHAFHEYEIDPNNTRIDFSKDDHIVVQESLQEVVALVSASL